MKLDISLHCSEEPGLVRAAIRSTRPTNIASLFSGKAPADASKLMPQIFSICAMAHRHACMLACGLYESREHELWGEALVLVETAREHCLHILSRWVDDRQKKDAAVAMRDLLGDVRALQSMSPEEAAAGILLLEEFSTKLQALIENSILGVPSASILALQTKSDLHVWAQQECPSHAIAACHVMKLFVDGAEALAAIPPHFLPELDQKHLSDTMLGDTGAAFVAQPTWDGHCCETGPLERTQCHPLISAMLKEHGATLLVRDCARLLDLLSVANAISRLSGKWNEAKGRSEERILASHGSHPTGLGIVETARGRLIHAVCLEEGKIGTYRILAPTEWNFHPKGAAQQSLQALTKDTLSETLVHSVLSAIDPCVAFDVTIKRENASLDRLGELADA